MGKVTLLFAGKSYDTDVQNVRENQIVIFDGPYNMRQRMVVAGIAHTQSGYNYRLIDPETAEEHSADLIRPLRDKFGIGHYYDDEHPEFMDAAEVAALRTRADALKAEQEAARRAAAEDAERLRTIGAERLRQIVPDDAVAVIIGEQHESECDPYTDYFGSRIVRTVILGFSTHTRDLFPEMRKAAARFEGTAHLAERNAEYEHCEKYSMGHGYYLGTHRYSGWQVSKESCRDKEGIIKRFAVVAGNSDNVCIENPAPVQTAAPETVADARVEIVEYSAKSIAVFGDTKPLRDTLRDLNGLFRAYLTHDGTRRVDFLQTPRTRGAQRIGRLSQITFNPGRASARPTTPESMNEQITAIAALLLEINGKEKYTAFFDFSGHVRTFSIRIYSGKWSQGKAPLFNLSLQNKDGQQWRNWDNAHAMSGDSILSFLTTLL